jgi:hypothetical protein
MTDVLALLSPAEPGQLTPTSLLLREGIAIEDWSRIGAQLARVDRAYRWWVGDWLNYGEREYGEMYAEALERTGLDYQQLANCKWVSAAVGVSHRCENLSWGHHYEVAALVPDDQDFWLERATGQLWTRQQLRAHIKGPKALPEPTDEHPLLLLRFCQAELPTATIVSLILRVAFPDAERALDMTYGSGAFWDGSSDVQVTAHDANPARALDGVADFTRLDYPDGSFDVALFDPPHIADAGAESIMRARFGTYGSSELPDVIVAGTREAWRVARLGIIVKVTDHSHSQEYVLESDWVRSALDGRKPYDVVHQVRTGALVDPKWEEQKSAYNNGSTYLIFRKDSQKHILRGRRREQR